MQEIQYWQMVLLHSDTPTHDTSNQTGTNVESSIAYTNIIYLEKIIALWFDAIISFVALINGSSSLNRLA